MPSRSLSRFAVATAVALAAVSLPTAEAFAETPPTKIQDDFNGDGYEDLAVAAPLATVGDKTQAGYVAVLYGTASGLNTAARQVYTQASPGVPGAPEKYDYFGSGLDSADLDGDGFTDLLVTASGEDWKRDDKEYRFRVTVLWGGRDGFASGVALSAVGNGVDQDSDLASGDFNGDGHQDLIRRDRVEFGPLGRDGSPASVQEPGLVGAENETAHEIVAGDVDGDGITDVVERHIVSHLDDTAPQYSLRYFRGSKGGLEPHTVLKDAQGEPVDAQGFDLALGDLNGDGRADLVNGDYTVEISFGTENGPDTTRTRVIDQDTPGVPGTQEPEDSFGNELTVGDVDGDGYGDILVGNPFERVGTVSEAGSVAVVPGGADGPTGAGTRVLSQQTAGVPGVAEAGDRFGWAFDLVDGDGDGRAEPVVGAFRENGGRGAVWVFPTTSSGVTAEGSFVFGAGTLGTVDSKGRLGKVFPN
ncbi:FG-GAP and VCBS repeat-containing protein [Streptomyces sp. NPDC050803]|uniref:FG-GAP repeat domain-containing protein n=1 Tax=unclassified Streptomyces TaxID=2593676 RepID=UPI00342DB2C6